jgi:hypothetical protein
MPRQEPPLRVLDCEEVDGHDGGQCKQHINAISIEM